MAAERVYLSGGPCNGRTVPASQIQGGIVGYVACGGGYYLVTGDKRRPNGDLVLTWGGKTKPKPPSGTGANTRNATQAWTRWMRALGHQAPRELKRIHKAGARARRIAR